MQDFVNTILLICAALASLALGVMLAYGICQMTFAALRIHARSVKASLPQTKAQPQAARLS
jgi:hypothetical protein